MNPATEDLNPTEPLYFACMMGNVRIAKILLRRGAQVKSLWLSSLRRNFTQINMLIKKRNAWLQVLSNTSIQSTGEELWLLDKYSLEKLDTLESILKQAMTGTFQKWNSTALYNDREKTLRTLMDSVSFFGFIKKCHLYFSVSGNGIS